MASPRILFFMASPRILFTDSEMFAVKFYLISRPAQATLFI